MHSKNTVIPIIFLTYLMVSFCFGTHLLKFLGGGRPAPFPAIATVNKVMVDADQFTPLSGELGTCTNRARAHFNAGYGEMKPSFRHYEVSSVILATKLCKNLTYNQNTVHLGEHYNCGLRPGK